MEFIMKMVLMMAGKILLRNTSKGTESPELSKELKSNL